MKEAWTLEVILAINLHPIWTGWGGGAESAPPPNVFLHNSKTPGDIEK